jgi:hypothetical protein
MGTRRWLIVGIAVFVLVPLIAEARGTRVNWTFSGAFVQNLAKADSDEIALVTGRALLIQVQAHGSPGRATILGLNQSFLPNEPANDLHGCFAGAFLKLVGGFSENSLVAMFNDLSILNMVKDAPDTGFLCIGPDGRVDATVFLRFNGGFGRFQNATGTATLRLTSYPVGMIEVAPGVFEPSTLRSEIGTVTGTLYRN